MTVLTLLINAPLTAPLLSWVVARDQSIDNDQKCAFKSGVERFNVRTSAMIEDLKAAPCVGPSPHWEAVSELLLNVPATLASQFPKGTDTESQLVNAAPPWYS